MGQFYNQGVPYHHVVSLFEKEGFSIKEWGNGEHISLAKNMEKIGFSLEIFFSTEVSGPKDGLSISGEKEAGPQDQEDLISEDEGELESSSLGGENIELDIISEQTSPDQLPSKEQVFYFCWLAHILIPPFICSYQNCFNGIPSSFGF